MKAVWEKVFELSMPVHGSLSRKLRKGIGFRSKKERSIPKRPCS